MGRVSLSLGFIAAISVLGAGSAQSTTLPFSDASSDNTPAALLSATLSYAVTAPNTLQIAVRNDTAAATPFDIMWIFFNTSPDISYIQLASATSSVTGDNTAAWRLGYYGYDLFTAVFGKFDYSLRTEPGGPTSDRIAPGETQSFTLSVSCANYVGCVDGLLDGWSEGGAIPASLAMRFAYGPNGDAAFGARRAAVPEPTPAALIVCGLAALALRRRGR